MNTSVAKSKEDPIFVGCDDGHDSVKIVARTLNDKSEMTRLTLPSKIVRGSRAVSLTSDSAPEGVYSAGDEIFTVSDALTGSDVLDTRAIGFPTHKINRILVQDGMIRAGLAGKTVHLVTGLPVNDYYKDAKLNEALIASKKLNICDADIKALSGEEVVKIVDHRVACEAIAAVYDMAICDDGTDNVDFFKLLEMAPVGVIDIGGKTTDLAVVYLSNGMPQVDMARTSSLDYGMLRVAEQIKRELQIAHKVDEISPRALYKVMAERRVVLYGKDTDVSASVALALTKVLPDLFDRIRASWGNAQDLAKVIVVGGGAYLLADEIKNSLYPHAETKKEPEYANARGMLKLAMRSHLQNARG